jgi:hypothetical protein
VIQTDASFTVFFLLEDASTSCRKKLPFGAAVEDTDRSSDQLKV